MPEAKPRRTTEAEIESSVRLGTRMRYRTV